MIQLTRTPLYGGVFALAATALALFLSLIFGPLLEPNYFLPFLAAVLLSAWYSGVTGGLAATLLSSAAALYFFLPPQPGFAIADLNIGVRLGAFAGLGVLISLLAASGRRSQMLLSATLTSIGDGVIATDTDGRITYMNPVAAELTGWTQSEAGGRPVGEVYAVVFEDGSTAPKLLEKALREGTPVRTAEHVSLVSKSGTRIPIEDSAAPVRDHKGALRGGVVVFRDISGRRHLEEQLSHSQKMDAVGRLAGGVAGDFNNVLTVITGYSELLRAEMPATNPLRRYADEIMWAAERAAALTRQLLAFSRGPGAQPRLVDLNASLATMEPMLRRLMGENIELILLPGPGLGRVKSDPSQIEQVVMNMATNARDAMPEGGKLVIETANVDLEDPSSSKKVGVKPGSYVMLAVSDTGVGMDAATRSHLFEPFFTTKEPGKGSGLGLSTVYGIVRQGEGQVTVYSQPGCGTIFEIYLPRVTEAVGTTAARRQVKPQGSETILLVDDEEGVRKLVSAILQGQGYTVIEAGSGAAALAAYEKNAHKTDLVLTDVVMPQMNGFELGERLAQANPEVKILFMSGYRDNPIGGQTANRAFLPKPFTPDTLLEKVREVLDSRVA
jgi:two-component system, cell cycle sensor histidine kinase and response regulator CckA